MTHLTVPEWGRVAVGEAGYSRAEANALLASARAHPLSGRDGTQIICDHYRYLRAQQMVGVVAGRGCSLEILPKVDPAATDELPGTVRARLVHMLDVALGLNLSVGEISDMARGADSLLEVFIALFADRLLAEVRRGLPKQYRAFEDDLRALRGRLIVRRQLTTHAVRPDRLACRFDALDSDSPLMQVMKACVLVLARHARAAATQRKLAELRFLLNDITEVQRGGMPWRQVRIDRTSRRWQALLNLARLLLREDWQQTHAQAREPDGISLLFPMNELFERYVAAQLQRAMIGSGLEVVAQGGLRYCLEPWNGDGGYSHATRPDILIRTANGDVVCVLDTKWKPLANGVAQSDVYQMMAYARLYHCPRLVLLYPAVPGEVGERIYSRTLANGLERLDALKLNLCTTAEDVRLELRSLLNLVLPG